MFSPIKEKSTKIIIFIKFYSHFKAIFYHQKKKIKKYQKRTEIWARRLPKGCYHDRGLVQGSAFSQSFDWVLLSSNCWSLQIFESSDFPALCTSVYCIHRKPYWCFFQKVSPWGQYVWRHLYPNTQFWPSQRVEGPCFALFSQLQAQLQPTQQLDGRWSSGKAEGAAFLEYDETKHSFLIPTALVSR